MASRHLRIWLYRLLLLKSDKNGKGGFTLIELLVAIIIAALVVSGLLFLVVEMLQLDRREFVLNQTQQDIQRAMAYISDDVQEAVYVYSTATSVSSQITDGPANGIPVLAFWRPDPLPDSAVQRLNSGTSFCSTPSSREDECNVLKLRQYTYSLVVYYLVPNNGTTLWEGPSRIVRYELPRYQNISSFTSMNDLNPTSGYDDPTFGGTSFRGWSATGTTAGQSPVLVDYIDASTATVANVQDCNGLGANYTRSPADVNVTSFFVCAPDNLGANGGNINQDIYLFLRGNALDGRDGLINSRNEEVDNPTLETRVQVRGVLDKRPE
ncbi:MAG: prepilin-type N-terminal cleavage/methylation domain-containing protein [Cyanobacteria bacterium P01_H01_bin.119]